MSLQIATVTNSIASLSVSGVTIKDKDDFITEAGIRATPLLQPSPAGFVSDVKVEILSTGIGAGAHKDVFYTLNYVFLHSEIGTGRSLAEVYSDMVDKAFAIADAVLTNDSISGCVDIQLEGMGDFGPIADPSGRVYNGCSISFRVQEIWS